MIRKFPLSLPAVLALLLAGCQSLEQLPGTGTPDRRAPAPPAPTGSAASTGHEEPAAEPSPRSAPRTPAGGWKVHGSGRYVAAPPLSADSGSVQETGGDEVLLDFEQAELREVVQVILGEMLGLDYILDDRVQGRVTMQTAAPIPRRDLLPTLETLLRMNGAALVRQEGRYQVVPAAEATRGLLTPRLAEQSRPLPPGHGLIIRPLRHVSAGEMAEILQPLVRDTGIVRVDERRNLLVLAGTSRELEQVLTLIDTFDVNWLRGMSVGFFPLENAALDEVRKELDVVLGSEAGKALGGLVRITAVPSANGFLVVSRQPEYLDEVGEWIRRFDRLSLRGEEPRIFIYRVRNGKAESLAALLNDLYATPAAAGSGPPALAPGRRPVTLASTEPAPAGEEGNTATAPSRPVAETAASASGVRVVADPEHNSLLILATPRDYRRMLDTLRQLDIIPLQVHIEATIVEVLLRGQLKYGISWFFRGGAGGYRSVGGVGGSTTGIDLTGGIRSLAQGFNWSLIDSTGAVRAVLNAFASDSLVNVLSAPSVMVLDNQEAVIQVGDEVPTLTQRQGTEGNAVIESVTYRNTGIILKVKPRVNPGGLVTMEVSQEVSAVADTEVATNQPTIQTRRIRSTVAVQSGQTVVLGGLIRDRRSNADGGVPVLYKLPGVGALFGDTERENERVELVVVLTPRVISSAEDALYITRDFRARMQGLKEEFLRQAGLPEEKAERKGPAADPP